jgi:hypothetical protein
MYIGIQEKYRLFFSDFNETGIFSTDFGKYLNTKFHENPSSGNRVLPCGRRDGQTGKQAGLTKLIFAVRNFPKAPKKICYSPLKAL